MVVQLVVQVLKIAIIATPHMEAMVEVAAVEPTGHPEQQLLQAIH